MKRAFCIVACIFLLSGCGYSEDDIERAKNDGYEMGYSDGYDDGYDRGWEAKEEELLFEPSYEDGYSEGYIAALNDYGIDP